MLPSDPVQQLPLLPTTHTAATSRVAAWLLQHDDAANDAVGTSVPVEAAVPGHEDCDSGDDCADLALLHLHDSLDEAATEVGSCVGGRCSWQVCPRIVVGPWLVPRGPPAAHAELQGQPACLPRLPCLLHSCGLAGCLPAPTPTPTHPAAGCPGGRGLRGLPLHLLLRDAAPLPGWLHVAAGAGALRLQQGGRQTEWVRVGARSGVALQRDVAGRLLLAARGCLLSARAATHTCPPAPLSSCPQHGDALNNFLAALY